MGLFILAIKNGPNGKIGGGGVPFISKGDRFKVLVPLDHFFLNSKWLVREGHFLGGPILKGQTSDQDHVVRLKVCTVAGGKRS